MNYPMINMKATGIRLRQLMKQKKISPKDVQDYLGLSCVQSVYRWISGCSIPTVDHLYALSALFRIPMDQMIVGDRAERAQAGPILLRDKQRREVIPEQLSCLHGQMRRNHFAASNASVECEAFHVCFHTRLSAYYRAVRKLRAA